MGLPGSAMLLFGVRILCLLVSVTAPLLAQTEQLGSKTSVQQHDAKHGRFSLRSAALLAIVAAAPMASAAQSSQNEEYALAQVARGLPVDLRKRPNRSIDAGFIAKLLFTLPLAQASNHPITILGADIKGEMVSPQGGASAKNDVVFEDCTFDRQLELDFMKFEKGLTIADSHSDHPLVISFTDVKGDLEISNSTFKSLLMKQDFIEGHFRILFPRISSIFAQRVEAKTMSMVAGEKEIRHVFFSQVKTSELFFIGQQEGAEQEDFDVDSVLTDQAVFGSAVQHQSPVSDLTINANITGNLTIAHIAADKADLSGIQVTGQTLLGPGFEVFDTLMLEQAHFGSFFWLNEKDAWPSTIRASGLSFSDFSVSRSIGSNDESMEFFGRSQNPEAPLNLFEAVLRSEGQSGVADDAYVLMRAKRKRDSIDLAENPSQKISAYFFYILDTLQKIFFGYGRFAGPPLAWSLVFVMTGTTVFTRRMAMEPKDPDDLRAYSPFWYSLELFLPVVDLGVAKSWRPKPRRRALQIYARFHQLAGWILIPASLAALTGAVK